jgi:4-hydroxy-tetrahydrodipicolinate synthase
VRAAFGRANHPEIFMKTIQGSIPAILSPMQEDGALDLPGFERLLDWHVAEGTDAVVVVGTTGESPTVDVEEHCALIETAVRRVAGRIPVIAGTGANSTREAIELAKFARRSGADAHLSVVPYYNKPTQEGPVPAFQGHCRGRRFANDPVQRARTHGRRSRQ